MASSLRRGQLADHLVVQALKALLHGPPGALLLLRPPLTDRQDQTLVDSWGSMV